MAFCKNCGEALADAKFCARCGCPAEGIVGKQIEPVGAYVDADERKQNLSVMENMMCYFGEKTVQYEEYDTVCQEIESRTKTTHISWLVAAVIALVIAILGGYVFYAVVVLCVFAFSRLSKRNAEKLAIAEARREELWNELTQHYNNFGDCAVGLEYTNPSVLEELYDLIRKGRAKNPNEAINIYHADIRDMEFMERQEELLAETRRIEKATKKAR